MTEHVEKTIKEFTQIIDDMLTADKKMYDFMHKILNDEKNELGAITMIGFIMALEQSKMGSYLEHAKRVKEFFERCLNPDTLKKLVVKEVDDELMDELEFGKHMPFYFKDRPRQ